MKTPEEMAEEYASDEYEYDAAKEAFLAGYNAALKIAESEFENICNIGTTGSYDIANGMSIIIKSLKNENT
jgi:hypothetical protein